MTISWVITLHFNIITGGTMENKVVILGAGNIGERHAETIRTIKNMNLVGFYDTNLEKAKKIALKYGVRYFHCLEDIFSDRSINIADVCTPPCYHYELSVNLIRNGKHIIVEKPLFLELAQIDSIINLSQACGVQVCAISQHRFSQAAVKIKETLSQQSEKEKIKNIKLNIQRSRNNDFMRVSKDNWKSDKSIIGGGVLITIAIHYVDLLCWIIDLPYSVVSCCSDVENTYVESNVKAFVRFNQIPCNINAKWGNVENKQDELSFVMSDGEITLRGDNIVGEPAVQYDRYSLHRKQLENFNTAILNNTRTFITPADIYPSLSLILDLYKHMKKEYENDSAE